MILVLVQAQVNIIFYKSKCARNWKIVDLSRNCAVCIILQTLWLSPKGKRNSIEKASKFVEAPVLPTLILVISLEIDKFFAQNHDKWRKLSYTDFTFHANGEKWNHAHSRFTDILVTWNWCRVGNTDKH